MPEDKPKANWSGQTDQPLPEPTFKVHVSALASQVLLHLGVVPFPGSGEKKVDLKQAEFVLGMISMLEEKTRGNLDDAERAFLEHVVRDLRSKLELASEGH